MKYLNSVLIIIFFLSITGCVGNYVPMNTEPAKVGPSTRITSELKSLPKPQEKIVAAVYKFRDQTGQYKASSTGTSWSTAVTQGATSILLRALEESGWFIPIEREGLSNLLNERKIIRSSRATYNNKNNEDEALLPPLLFAGIVLEGGIISYETNILTGGVGTKYFGTGASSEYRQDRVTVYLRAISTSNGRILKTVYSTKTILSQLVDVGLFRFVDIKKLLEVEVGYSYNEPPEMCITEAIEKAVYGLIIEGAEDGLWSFADSSAINSKTVLSYLEEKKEASKIDALGNNLSSLRSSFGIGLNVGGQNYVGDYGDSRMKSAWGLTILKSLTSNFYLGADLSIGELANNKMFTNKTSNIELKGYYHFLPQSSLSPYMVFGFGTTIGKLEDNTRINVKEESEAYLSLTGGLGVEYMLSDFLALNILGKNTYLFTDKIDGAEYGKMNDYFWGIQVGFTIYPRF